MRILRFVLLLLAGCGTGPRSFAESYVEKLTEGRTADAQEMHCAGRPIDIQPFRSSMSIAGVYGDDERSCIEASIDIDRVGRGTMIAIDVWKQNGRRCIHGVRVLGVCHGPPTPGPDER